MRRRGQRQSLSAQQTNLCPIPFVASLLSTKKWRQRRRMPTLPVVASVCDRVIEPERASQLLQLTMDAPTPLVKESVINSEVVKLQKLMSHPPLNVLRRRNAFLKFQIHPQSHRIMMLAITQPAHTAPSSTARSSTAAVIPKRRTIT